MIDSPAPAAGITDTFGIRSRPLVATMLVFAVVYVVVNLVVDLIYPVVDPRIVGTRGAGETEPAGEEESDDRARSRRRPVTRA